MFLLRDDGRLILSPSDLRLASQCEFALVRELDVTLGRVPKAPRTEELMMERLKELGDAHERQELLRLSAAHPGRVKQFPRPAYDLASLTAAHQNTIATLAGDDTDVVFQATFFDGGLVGHADFLERTDDGWLVCDTKLARSASVPALLQIAAYAAQLRSAGVPTAPVARLVLGSGVSTDHLLDDILPVYAARRARLEAVLAEHRSEAEAAVWGDPRWLACGRCEVCEAESEAARDVLLVAGVRLPQRRRLMEAGVTTIDDLAGRTEPVPDVRESALTRLRDQARLQLEQESDPAGAVVAEVVSAEALRAMPTPSDGDIFFDFEGDPLWSERGSHEWGLEYLFGLVEIDGVDLAEGEKPRFMTFWAHDRAQEKQALIDFVAYLHERRRQWPGLHVYHYAPYEKTALLRLAARHGVCEDDIDQFLRDGVFVDLYAVVRAGIRVSQRSYSIKKLEPLYMGDRTAAVAKGDDSIVAYHRFVLAREIEDRATAEREIQDIANYNEEDCVSTLLLRNWLLSRLVEADGVGGPNGATAAPPSGDGSPPAGPVQAPSETRLGLLHLERMLRDSIDGVKRQDRTPEQQTVAMVAATLLFHAREDKPFWWKHFDRLRLPVSEWMPDTGVFVIQRVEVREDWHRATARQRPRRTIVVTGEPMGGVLLGPGAEIAAVYGSPPPVGIELLPGHLNARSSATVRVIDADDHIAPNGHVHQTLTLEELMPKDGDEHSDHPVALVPSGTVRTTNIDAALERLARRVQSTLPALPAEAGVDVLLRRPPRLRSGAALPVVGDGNDGYVRAIETALLDLDRSALSVQGPPGTGKTYVASQVIASLVRDHGWRVGVCAQSHASIENVLAAVVEAGVDPEVVAKMTKETDDPPWHNLASADELAGFAAEQPAGYVIGGTAWDLTNPRRVEPGQLDLLVIDEAGQYSLAKTLAVAEAADRLLLLGDPQQLPQVSQGTHPEPVDASALGWVIQAEREDESVLPETHGYFLATTWRMHPALTEPVSRLAYEGRLVSHEDRTAQRSLDGVEPGLHVRLVDHRDRAQWSPEEADVVVNLVRDHLGRDWQVTPGEASRPLGQEDILVITPYNAQVGTLRAALDAAGFAEVAVGTVDKFQGREAAVAIISMAASAHADVPRGIGFLLDRHRLNVAVSRAQHAAYLVRSSVLTDFAPRTPEELTALGAFLGLCERAVETAESSGSATSRVPPELPCSRSALDKLGQRIGAAGEIPVEDRELWFNVLDAYDQAKVHVQAVCASIAATIPGSPSPGPRLKSDEMVIQKLEREHGMALKGMQDLAGVRISHDLTLSQQTALGRRIQAAFQASPRKPRWVDRRDDPMHGYRAVHIIVHDGSIPVEVQVRTRLQDSWAQTMEKLGDVWGRAIRYGGAPDEPDHKAGESTRGHVIAQLKNLSELGAELERADQSRNPQHVMQAVRRAAGLGVETDDPNPFDDEVSDIVTLPSNTDRSADQEDPSEEDEVDRAEALELLVAVRSKYECAMMAIIESLKEDD